MFTQITNAPQAKAIVPVSLFDFDQPGVYSRSTPDIRPATIAPNEEQDAGTHRPRILERRRRRHRRLECRH